MEGTMFYASALEGLSVLQACESHLWSFRIVLALFTVGEREISYGAGGGAVGEGGGGDINTSDVDNSAPPTSSSEDWLLNIYHHTTGVGWQFKLFKKNYSSYPMVPYL